jgi:pantetheine-phosphate adenylyltransferase
MKTALYPGTFDPITLGHVDILQRGITLFDKIVIAVSESAGKSPLFSLQQRLNMVQQTFADHAEIEVISFSGLLVDLMHEQEVNIVLRGIRSSADVEHEFQLSGSNLQMKPNMETVFIQANPKYAHISSTIVREIARMQKPGTLGDLSLFVPPAVMDAVEQQSLIHSPPRL